MVWWSIASLPACEPATRGGCVDLRAAGVSCRLQPVLPQVLQHVAERVPYLARARQLPDVIAASHDLSVTREHAVHGERDSRADGLHPPPERDVILRFDDQVQVVSLDRVVHEPKARPGATGGKALTQCCNEAIRAERRQTSPDPHSDERRHCAAEPFAADVMYDRSLRGLATRKLAWATSTSPLTILEERNLPGDSTHNNRIAETNRSSTRYQINVTSIVSLLNRLTDHVPRVPANPAGQPRTNKHHPLFSRPGATHLHQATRPTPGEQPLPNRAAGQGHAPASDRPATLGGVTKIRLAVASGITLLCLEAPTMSDQLDPRLDDLFEALAAAPSDAHAEAVEQQIWAIWFDAGDSELDRRMAEGAEAMNRGDADAALGAFGAVIAARPDYAESWNWRATLYYLMRRFPESVADIERTLALEPRHFGALSGLALIREAQNEPFQALEALEQVTRIHPRMPHLAERVDKLSSMLGEAI